MTQMRMGKLCGGVLAGLSITAASSVKAATVYDADTGLFSVPSTSPGYAQQVILPTGPSSYLLNSFPKLGIEWNNIGLGSQWLNLDFYSNADTSGTSTNAFGLPAVLLDHEAALLTPQPTVGGFNYSLSFGTPVSVPDTFTLVVTMNNTANTAYSAAIGGLFTSGTLAAGADPGFVWVDSNLNSIFTGAEQSTAIGGGSPSHALLVIDATPVPEPTSTAALALAAAALVKRRRRTA